MCQLTLSHTWLTSRPELQLDERECGPAPLSSPCGSDQESAASVLIWRRSPLFLHLATEHCLIWSIARPISSYDLRWTGVT